MFDRTAISMLADDTRDITINMLGSLVAIQSVLVAHGLVTEKQMTELIKLSTDRVRAEVDRARDTPVK